MDCPIYEKWKEQKPAEWSEEEIRKIFDDFAECRDTYTSCINRLKALRPQSNQEWREEDERLLSKLELYVDMECFDRECNGEDLRNWLKSLKNRGNSPKSNANSPWKPSKEELELLSSTIDVLRKGGHAFFAENLESIREELRKLI